MGTNLGIAFPDLSLCVCQLLGCVQLFATLQTVACQAPPSMGFSRQEYWSGLPFLSPGEFPDPGIKPRSPAMQADSLPPELNVTSRFNKVWRLIQALLFLIFHYQILIFFETSNLSQSPAELSASFLGGGWDLGMLPCLLITQVNSPGLPRGTLARLKGEVIQCYGLPFQWNGGSFFTELLGSCSKINLCYLTQFSQKPLEADLLMHSHPKDEETETQDSYLLKQILLTELGFEPKSH